MSDGIFLMGNMMMFHQCSDWRWTGAKMMFRVGENDVLNRKMAMAYVETDTYHLALPISLKCLQLLDIWNQNTLVMTNIAMV